MSKNTVIKGGDIMVFVGGKSIAMSTNHTLSISASTTETSSKDSGGFWQTSEVGILSWTVSSENILCSDPAGEGYDALFKLMIAREPVELVIAVEGDSENFADGKLGEVNTAGWKPKANDGYTGKAIITSLEKNMPNGENASWSVEFTGVGQLTEVKTA